MTLRTRPILGSIIWVSSIAFCGVVLTLAATYLYLDPQTPRADTFRQVRLETPLRIYSREGQLLAEFGERRAIPISIDQIPRHFLDAVVSIEDKRFYEHSGIDFVSLLNDSLILIKNYIMDDGLGAGASTITMQLARNVSFSLERTFIRKFKEMLLALKLEQELTKDEILELYINVVPFGKRAYGAEAGARTYYGKSLNELELSELAMLAGIPQAPSANNPINGPEKALLRRDTVLDRMFEQGAITEAELSAAKTRPLTARLFEPQLDVASPYAAEWIRQQLIQSFPNLYTAGYEVHTTIDANLQSAATTSLRDGLEAYDRRHGYRGPEARLPVELTTLLTTDPAAGREQAREAVQALPAHARLEAAAAVVINENSAELILTSGEVAIISLADAKWARPFLSVDSIGPVPTRMSDVLQIGDIVRLKQNGEQWVLAQTPAVQGALVSLEPDTGKVLAMSGGYDFGLNQFNHATQAARQPGSGFKPFIYAAALAEGRTTATTYMDAPLVFRERGQSREYRPKNSDNKYNGPTRLRQALYRSVNIVTIRVLLDVGAGPAMQYAANFGFDISKFPRDTQLAVGGGTLTLTPLEMARAYSVFANGGYLIQPYGIESMKNSDGEELLNSRPPRVCHEQFAVEVETIAEEGVATDSDKSTDTDTVAALPPGDAPTSNCLEPAIDTRIAYIMHDMLKDVIRRGTARRALVLKRADLAGKTGTTDEAADTWFNGYTPDVATTVWVGFKDVQPLGRREFGSTVPLPIWIDYMKVALADRPEKFLDQPEGIVNMRVSGGGVSEFEYFLAEHMPSQRQEATSPVIQQQNTIQSVDLF